MATPKHSLCARITHYPGMIHGILFGLVGSILLFHACYYLPFIADDALISLRYAARLLAGKGLTWTDGAPVEGFSNLLWVLMTAALGATGIDLIDTTRILGVSLMLLAIYALVFDGLRRRPAAYAAQMVVLPFFALCSPIAIWAVGGLEQALVAALLAWALTTTTPLLDKNSSPSLGQILFPGLCYALLAITRPDGMLFLGCAGLAVLLVRGINRNTVRICFLLSLLPILFYGGQLLFRLYYYHDWVPNTARAKLAPSQKHFAQGLQYVKNGLLLFSPFLYIALFGSLIVFCLPKRFLSGMTKAPLLLFFITGTVWASYVIFIGGDIFPGWRHIVPLIVPLSFLLLHSLEFIFAKLSRWWLRLPLVLLIGGLIYPCFQTQHANKLNQAGKKERWEWTYRDVGLMFKNGFCDEQPLVALTVAGSLAYWSELPALDMLGLNDRYLAHHPPTNFGDGYLGHELGNGDYVLRRKPDIIVFSKRRARASFRSGKELERTAAFKRDYSLAQFTCGPNQRIRTQAWIRRDSEKTGIRSTEQHIEIPAYLLNGNSKTWAKLNEENQFVVTAERRQPVKVTLDIPPGEWRILPKGCAPNALRITARAAHKNASLNFNADTNTLHITGTRPKKMAFTLTPGHHRAVSLSGLTLQRP